MQKKEQMYEGKAKKVFATDDPNLVIVDYKDDATAFNGEKKGTIVGKGAINNVMSNHMFQLLEQQGVPTHFVEQLSERETVVKKVSIVPLEVIIRNISAGAFAKRYGIANGYLDGTFRPEQPVSRAELVKLIASYFTVEGGTSPFPDVPDGHWAAEVVSFAAEEGWVSGYPDGTFRPDAPVSRAEAVKILNHALDRRAGERAAALPFTDVEKGHWACDEIREAAVSHIYRKSGEGETWLTYER